MRHALVIIAVGVLLLSGCSGSITDAQGRKLPAQGATATLVEKHGWLATTEAAIPELMAQPKINLLATPPEQAAKLLDEALAQNASRLMKEGKVIQVAPGTKVRVLGYCVGDSRNVRPLSPGERVATWVKVEALGGETGKRTGITTADGIQ